MDKAQLHFDVLEGRSDYIPLAITIPPRERVDITLEEAMNNPQAQIDAFLKNNENNLQFQSDKVVAIESNFLECLIPSMFGAKMYTAPGGVLDVKPCIDDLEDFDSIEVTEGLLQRAEEHVMYLKNNVPDNVPVAMTRFMSPLDYGVVMRGGDFYVDLLCEPELSMGFMEKVAHLTVDTIKHFKKLIGEPDDRQLSASTGFWIHGTRLTGDAIVNVSPDVIKEMLCPVFNIFRKELGGVVLHYCCTPAPSGHVLPTLAECDGAVRAVDNWQGYKTFFNDNGDGMLQDKVAMFADFSFSDVSDVEGFMSQDIFSKVKRKGGRGFVVRTTAPTIDEAKRLYDRWQNYFAKRNML